MHRAIDEHGPMDASNRPGWYGPDDNNGDDLDRIVDDLLMDGNSDVDAKDSQEMEDPKDTDVDDNDLNILIDLFDTDAPQLPSPAREDQRKRPAHLDPPHLAPSPPQSPLAQTDEAGTGRANVTVRKFTLPSSRPMFGSVMENMDGDARRKLARHPQAGSGSPLASPLSWTGAMDSVDIPHHQSMHGVPASVVANGQQPALGTAAGRPMHRESIVAGPNDKRDSAKVDAMHGWRAAEESTRRLSTRFPDHPPKLVQHTQHSAVNLTIPSSQPSPMSQQSILGQSAVNHQQHSLNQQSTLNEPYPPSQRSTALHQQPTHHRQSNPHIKSIPQQQSTLHQHAGPPPDLHSVPNHSHFHRHEQHLKPLPSMLKQKSASHEHFHSTIDMSNWKTVAPRMVFDPSNKRETIIELHIPPPPKTPPPPGLIAHQQLKELQMRELQMQHRSHQQPALMHLQIPQHHPRNAPRRSGEHSPQVAIPPRLNASDHNRPAYMHQSHSSTHLAQSHGGIASDQDIGTRSHGQSSSSQAQESTQRLLALGIFDLEPKARQSQTQDDITAKIDLISFETPNHIPAEKVSHIGSITGPQLVTTSSKLRTIPLAQIRKDLIAAGKGDIFESGRR